MCTFALNHPSDAISLQISKFTLEQKVNVTTGVGWAIGRCVVCFIPDKG
jgi:hypothetical protein